MFYLLQDNNVSHDGFFSPMFQNQVLENLEKKKGFLSLYVCFHEHFASVKVEIYYLHALRRL